VLDGRRGEGDVGALQRARSFDPHSTRTIDHDLSDVGVGEQRFERTEAGNVGEDVGDGGGLRVVSEQGCLLTHERPHPLLERRARITVGKQEPVADARGERAHPLVTRVGSSSMISASQRRHLARREDDALALPHR